MNAVIVGHGKASVCASRMHNNWRRAGITRFHTVCPHNDPWTLHRSVTSVHAGASQHSGGESRVRWLTALLLASAVADDRGCAIIEYDAMVWRPFFDSGLPQDGVLACGKVFDNGDYSYSAPTFTHWPIWGSKETLTRLAVAAASLRPGKDAYMPDRFVAAAAVKAGLSYESRSSFSCNAFDRPEYLRTALRHIQDGTLTCVHGVKDLYTQEALENAWEAKYGIQTG